MKKLFCSLFVGGALFAFAAPALAGTSHNYKAVIKSGGSWHTSYTFSDAQSCGSNCSEYWVDLSGYCDDVDGASVTLHTYDFWYYRSFVFYEPGSYTWGGDDEIGGYGIPIEWRWTVTNDDFYTSEDMCDDSHFLTLHYQYTNGGTNYYRQYNL